MKSESEIRNTHPHVIEGSVRYCPILNKQLCVIKTRGLDGGYDGNTRQLATSDLHQTFWTPEVKKQLDRTKAKAKRAVAKAAKQDAEPIVVLEDEPAIA